MLVEWEGREWQYHPAMIDVRTAIEIRKHTGLGLKSFEKGVDDADPICLQALLYAIKVQNGERPPIAASNFSCLEFYQAVADAAYQEITSKAQLGIDQMMAEAEAEDPTETGDPIPAETPTSEKSDPTI